MWRANILRRRESMHATGSSSADKTLQRIVLPRIDALYLLAGHEIFRLQQVSISFLHVCPPRQYFQKWLGRHEKSRGAIRQGVPALYREYHAARVVRRFLRSITQKHRSLVITGSFAAACYLESHGLEAWRPGDIDVFVSDEQVARDVESEFVSTLQAQLCMDVARHSWNPDVAQCEDTSLSLVLLGKDASVHATGSHWTPHDLRIAVGNWLASYFPAREHEDDIPEAEVDDVLAAEAEPSWTTPEQEMQRVMANLPANPQPSMLKMCSTVRLTPSSPKKLGTPAALLPINIIHVEPRIDSPPFTDIRECVCRNFDQAACCMTLSVSPDFVYTYHDLYGAADCLRDRRLQLRSQAFSCQRTDVEQQMKRIWKYVLRGFKFPDDRDHIPLPSTTTA